MSTLTKELLLQGIQKVIKLHKYKKFIVEYIDTDLQFECIQNDIDGVKVDIVDTDNHVEVIERAIQMVKENIRSLI